MNEEKPQSTEAAQAASVQEPAAAAPMDGEAAAPGEEAAEQEAPKEAPKGLKARIVNFVGQLTGFFGVSLTQTLVEFGSYALLNLAIGIAANISNVVAIISGATYKFVMSRQVIFKSSSSVVRSIVLFVLLQSFNLLFSTTCLTLLPQMFGWDTTIIKIVTMFLQGCWGFLLCRYVIFK